MNKAELIEELAARFRMPQREAKALVQTIFDAMAAALARGEKVELGGFGSFRIRRRRQGEVAAGGGSRPGPSSFRTRLARLNVSLSWFQTVVGLAAGIVSITGALFAIPDFFRPVPVPGKGEVVAIVQDAKTDKAVSDATVEILTPQNAIVTTLTPNWFGKARCALQEGQYRIRVSHPRFGVEIRQVQVVSGQTAEVRVPLRAGASSALRHAERVIDEGVTAIRRLFGR